MSKLYTINKKHLDFFPQKNILFQQQPFLTWWHVLFRLPLVIFSVISTVSKVEFPIYTKNNKKITTPNINVVVFVPKRFHLSNHNQPNGSNGVGSFAPGKLQAREAWTGGTVRTN